MSDTPCRIKFWGVRGSVPTPGPATVFYGGNTSCVEVRADGEIIVLDAGTGIRPLGLALAEEFRDEPLHLTLLLTHAHWDHIQGFPFFLPAYKAQNTLRVLGYEGAKSGLASTLAGQMESPYFPIGLGAMPGNILIEELTGFEFAVGRVRVTACPMNHPGIAVGYRLWTSGGSVAYLPDHEPLRACECGAEDSGRNNNRHADFVRGADVLVIDTQYDCEEYRAHIGWGHGCLDGVVDFAIAAEVKRLFLFHHDPQHDDAKIASMLGRARKLACAAGSGLRIDAAREGEECVLGGEP